MSNLTLSSLLRNIRSFEAKNGFKPRVIKLDRKSYDAVSSEVVELCQYKTVHNILDDTMQILGINVVTDSQTLEP